MEGIFMNTDNGKDVRYVVYAFILFSLFIFGSILIDFKPIDIIYFILLMLCFVKHELIKRKRKDYT
jgi:hypothetical protein